MEKEQMSSLLLRLAGAFNDTGFDKDSERIKRIDRILGASNYPLHDVVDFLSHIEREVTNIGLWKAIVLLKAVIAGKKTEQEFTDHIWKLQGLT